jgi:hypothetical protein
MSQDVKILTETSLQVFFFDHLQEFNKKSINPLTNEAIYYSSLVMDNFSESTKFFEQDGDRSREKLLGIKLLESTQMTREKQKTALRDIAETSLMVCGFFADSLNRKVVDAKYYEDLGRIAYSRLNSLSPKAFDIPSFYNMMSRHFNDVTLLMNLVSKKCSAASDPAMPWLIIKERKAS